MAIVHTGSQPPEFEWAKAAVVMDIHTRYEINKGRLVDMTPIQKRRRPQPVSDDSRMKRRRTTPDFTKPPLHTPSIARLSLSPKSFTGVPESDSDEDSSGASGLSDDDNSPNKGIGSEDSNNSDESDSADGDTEAESSNSANKYPRYDSFLERWASEALHATGNRRHIIGLLVSGFKMRFYFYDRAGAICTQPLDIENLNDARLFVGAIISLSMLSPFDLGLEPFFAPAPRTPFFCTPIYSAAPSCPRTTSVSWTDLEKAQGKVVHVAGQDFIVEDLIMSTPSLFGRGTTVYGVRPALPTPYLDPISHGLPSKPSLHQDDRRERRSFATSPHHSTIPIEEKLILKLSWQVLSRQSEDDLLRLAEERGVEGVIRLYKSAVVGRLSNGLRGKMVPKGLYIDRELRIQILGPRCIPLKRVGDVNDIKIAFRSLLKGP